MKKIKAEFLQFCVLLKSVPAVATSLFVVSVFAMNLLANKSIELKVDWLALDCGIIVSWLVFLIMDTMTKHFGPKAATEMSVFAICINLVFCLILFVGSKIPGVWGESYVEGSEGTINAALDGTFGGVWYVVFGSTAAFVVSAFVNNFLNFAIGKLFKSNPDGAAAYFMRSYISTAIGQFVDNMIFALVVSHFFFGWSYLQCFTCAVTGMLAELICEVVFSLFGYKICVRWKDSGVGEKYFQYIEGEKG